MSEATASGDATSTTREGASVLREWTGCEETFLFQKCAQIAPVSDFIGLGDLLRVTHQYGNFHLISSFKRRCLIP
jgi:hypothetical protein